MPSTDPVQTRRQPPAGDTVVGGALPSGARGGAQQVFMGAVVGGTSSKVPLTMRSGGPASKATSARLHRVRRPSKFGGAIRTP